MSGYDDWRADASDRDYPADSYAEEQWQEHLDQAAEDEALRRWDLMFDAELSVTPRREERAA